MDAAARRRVVVRPAAVAAAGMLSAALVAQQPQNPSPLVEHTRAHERVPEASPPGRREPLELGTLFVPASLRRSAPLLIHAHGSTWLPEVAAARAGGMAAITIQLGSGSAVYAKPFRDPGLFTRLLAEAETKAGVRLTPVILTSWSAGYGAVREILSVPDHYARVDRVLLIDGLHVGYVDGAPGTGPGLSSRIETAGLDVFLRFARDAVAGRKRMIVTHSEIFPGTYASTTETADWLLDQLGVRRRAVLRWGPLGMQQLSEARAGRFRLIGYAGNSAPDHVDQLHALPEFLDDLRR